MFAGTTDVVATSLLKILDSVYTGQRVLWLQMDSASDNRSKTMIALLAELVSLGVFDRAHLAFLKVGHTHSNIDGMFISKLLIMYLLCSGTIVCQVFCSE